MNTSKLNIHNTEIMFPLLTVDPGVNTAWALWVDTMRGSPIETGMYKVNRVEQTEHYLQDLIEICATKFKDVLDKHKPKTIVIEGCEVFRYNSKSVMSVCRNKKTNIPPLFLLAYLTGAYINIASQKNINVFIKNFKDWGGSLPAEAVRAQVELLTTTIYKAQHIYDAVGIGLNILGRM